MKPVFNNHSTSSMTSVSLGQTEAHVHQKTLGLPLQGMRRFAFKIAQTFSFFPPFKHLVDRIRAEQQELMKQLHGSEVANKIFAKGQMKTLPLNQRNLEVAETLAIEQAVSESKHEYLIKACRAALMKEGHSAEQLAQSRSPERFADVLLRHGNDLIHWSVNDPSTEVENLINNQGALQKKILNELNSSLLISPTEPLNTLDSLKALNLLKALSTSLEMAALLKINQPSTSEHARDALASGIPDYIGPPIKWALMVEFTKEEQTFFKNSLMLHHDLRDLVTLFSKESDVSAIKAELSSIKQHTGEKQNTGEQWIADMQQSATTLINLVKIIENNLHEDSNAVDEIFRADDWEQALTGSPIPNRLGFMSPSLRQDFEAKTGLNIKDMHPTYWKTIKDSTDIKPIVFESDSEYPDLNKQFVKDVDRLDYQINGNFLSGSKEARIEQFKQTIGENKPELIKVISQYATQTALNKINDFIQDQHTGHFVAAQSNSLTRILLDVREVTDDRIVITTSRQVQIKALLPKSGDLEETVTPLSPMSSQFDLTLTRNQSGQWVPQVSNISGAYRAVEKTA